jgi:hypothetical protein
MDILEDLIPDNIMDTMTDTMTDTISQVLAVVVPVAVTIAVLILLRLFAPPVINKIKEHKTFGKIRSGEEIPSVLHSHINKKKYVPPELLEKLLKTAEECEMSWSECSRYAGILQARARVKHYLDRELCIMLEVRECKSYIFAVTQKLWHIEKNRNRLTKLDSFKGHFYLKTSELLLRVDERTYEKTDKKALAVIFEFDKGKVVEIFEST